MVTLAFADALHLRGMERIKLPAALALLLRADLRGSAKREGERLLQGWLALDLAILRRMSRMIRPSRLRRYATDADAA